MSCLCLPGVSPLNFASPFLCSAYIYVELSKHHRVVTYCTLLSECICTTETEPPLKGVMMMQHMTAYSLKRSLLPTVQHFSLISNFLFNLNLNSFKKNLLCLIPDNLPEDQLRQQVFGGDTHYRQIRNNCLIFFGNENLYLNVVCTREAHILNESALFLSVILDL